MAKKTEVRITRPDGASTDQASIAQALIVTPLEASLTMTSYMEKPFSECTGELMLELAKQIRAVNEGDLSSVEGLLMGQAHSLNSIFCKLAQQASEQGHLDNLEMLLKLAMRAQAQCARTLEVLGNLKSPQNNAVFVRQANLGHNVQVNNQAGPSPASPQPAIEHSHDSYLDLTTATVGSRENPATTTMVEIDRANEH